jgi:hypothetical protein
MIRALLAAACFTAFLATAALPPLPGTTPQQALAGDIFPNPIRLLVTDAAGSAVPGAAVTWYFPPAGYSPLWTNEPGTCVSPPFGQAYDAAKLRVGAVGPYVLKFLDTNNATLEISVDGLARTLSITRQPF